MSPVDSSSTKKWVETHESWARSPNNDKLVRICLKNAKKYLNQPNSEKIPRNLAALVVLQCSKCYNLLPRTPKHEYSHNNDIHVIRLM